MSKVVYHLTELTEDSDRRWYPETRIEYGVWAFRSGAAALAAKKNAEIAAKNKTKIDAQIKRMKPVYETMKARWLALVAAAVPRTAADVPVEPNAENARSALPWHALDRENIWGVDTIEVND